jgi:hypothetical protein
VEKSNSKGQRSKLQRNLKAQSAEKPQGIAAKKHKTRKKKDLRQTRNWSFFGVRFLSFGICCGSSFFGVWTFGV